MLLAALLAAVTRGLAGALRTCDRRRGQGGLVCAARSAIVHGVSVTTLRMSLFVGFVPWGIVLIVEVLTGLLWRGAAGQTPQRL